VLGEHGPVRLLLGLPGLVVLAALATGGVWVAHDRGWGPFGSPVNAQGVNPFQAREQYVDRSALLVAADDQAHADGDARGSAVLDRMLKVPQGIWLLPERFPTSGSVGAFVAATQKAAGSDVPLFVVYGIPDRDCAAGQSSGGLDATTYLPWVQAIADAAGRDGRAAVVLEPDALATADQCHLADERVRLLSGAVTELRNAGVTTYVDAGHSSWVSVADMARLLRAVGVTTVRGFATDVSNYQPEDAETAYAGQLRRALGGAVHYVVDSGRNGAPGAGPTDWCNPPHRALGREPGYVADGTGLDALLWVKPPAESDGTCHGGPAAGEVWTQRAVALATAAGW
jgi:endoglucanase